MPNLTTTRKAHLDGLAVTLLLVCCLFWGFQQALAKASMAQLPPLFQAGVRSVGATLLLLIWCRWRGVAVAGRDGTLWPGLLAGLLFAAEFACIYLGLQYTEASRLTILLYTAPFWVAGLLALLIRSERLGALQWAGLVFAFAAVVFALQEGLAGAHSGSGTWRGDVLGLAAGLFWGLTTVLIRASALINIPAEKLLLYQLGVSALALPALSLALGENWPTQLSAFALSSLALQTVVGAFASYLVRMWMLGRYPATKMSVFVFLTPLFALLFGSVWLAEPVTPSLLTALTLVAVGIALVNRKPA